ncbi:hypothetical protein PBI_BEAGLE_118 [Arthrobacter phage Beagle]|nr:hypothetical protein PBI_BEAGLE_118 [Arthrobacter phage Beagle]
MGDDRTDSLYWARTYPTLCTTLGNLSRMPHPEDILAHFASRMPAASDAQVIEQAFDDTLN